ncbi:hypothetical protein EJ994_13895 [Maribacter sp. MJ134]|jgi:hypothetical protein|uniref:hypothetical protein n=1 Tax=unclassified Maribacter TaxID=2615042 RepID=UPI000F83A13E|nr:hypothetical protein [Maribacter sp. MJ134]AZQ59836.1 hypothetical protein EJ994_13895 [Maribacter sp. MJ134]
MQNEELENYFKSDKSEWYATNAKGEKKWDKNKVAEFWRRIREYKIDKKDFEFIGYVFPEFEEDYFARKRNDPKKKDVNFWKEGELSEFKESIYFDYSTFLGFIDFKFVAFFNTASFLGVKFLSESNFNFALFKGSAIFSRCGFFNDTFFYKTTFKDETYFYRSSFQSDANFIDTNFKKCVFKRIIVGDNEVLFENIESTPNNILIFIDFAFKNNIMFRQCNMKAISFYKCDIQDAAFLNCNWQGNDRIILREEFYLREANIYLDDDVNYSLGDLEYNYRQLKKNFDNSKNWELSGFAYVSEMKIRQQSLWNERDYFQWFIYWFYGFFGGYTQSFKRPLVSLICLICTFSIIYYFIDFNLLKAIQRGVKGAMPFTIIDTQNPFNGYWLIARNVEFLIGGTLITFFVMALRKRFKQ